MATSSAERSQKKRKLMGALQFREKTMSEEIVAKLSVSYKDYTQFKNDMSNITKNVKDGLTKYNEDILDNFNLLQAGEIPSNFHLCAPYQIDRCGQKHQHQQMVNGRKYDTE